MVECTPKMRHALRGKAGPSAPLAMTRAALSPARLPFALVDAILVALHRRHRIGAGEPAVQVDVGAAARAERPRLALGRLAADRAGFRRGRLVGHDRYLGIRRRCASPRHSFARICASRITGPHLSISALRWRRRPSGLDPTAVVATSASCWMTS